MKKLIIIILFCLIPFTIFALSDKEVIETERIVQLEQRITKCEQKLLEHEERLFTLEIHFEVLDKAFKTFSKNVVDMLGVIITKISLK
jgi:hypothetical protein